VVCCGVERWGQRHNISSSISLLIDNYVLFTQVVAFSRARIIDKISFELIFPIGNEKECAGMVMYSVCILKCLSCFINLSDDRK
jgi:uncharacterized PurR-regulated membrane protein YhhQ (DUF165 family)